MRGPPAGIRSGLIPLIILTMAMTGSPAPASEEEQLIDVHFSSSTTIEKPADRFTIEIIPRNGSPLGLGIEIRPIQGTFTVEYDDTLHITYDDAEIRQGVPKVDTDLAWDYASGDWGWARLRQGFRLIPIVEIGFDELYGLSDWGVVQDSLPRPAAGDVLRRPAVAAEDITLHVFDTRSITGLAANPLILTTPIDPFGDTHAFADSASYSTSFIPYPCLRVDLDLRARIDFKYTMKNTQVCVRYSSDPADTNCWAQTDSLHCLTAYETLTIPVQIGCEEVRHKNIPFCPVTAEGQLALQVRMTVEVDAYSVAYDCTDLPDLPTAYSTSTSSPVDTLIFNQTVTLERADDDAIFVVDVNPPQQEITAPAENTTLYENTPTDIVWDPDLPTDLIACCSDSLLVDFYLEATDGTSGCQAVVVERTPNDGTYSWSPPGGLACSSQHQAMFLTARFYCGQSGGDLVFSHAYSDSFYIQDTSPGGKWR